MKTTLYSIPSSEIPLLLAQLGEAHYWRPSSPLLQFWNGQFNPTDIDAGAEPLSVLPNLPLTGPIVLNGVLDSEISAKVAHQIIDAHFQGLDQHWILIFPLGDIPPDLAPFVQFKLWPMPNTIAVAQLLEDRGIYGDRLLRASMGLYQRELEIVLDTQDLAVDEGDESQRTLVTEQAVSDYKRSKLQSKGIQYIPEPDCEAAGNDNIIAAIDRVGRLLTPEAEAAGLPFPKGMILLGIPGSGKSLAAKIAAKRLGVPLICADWGGLISHKPGESEQNVRSLLQLAEASSPCIMFFDDFDKAFASADLSQENAVEKRLAGSLLTWLQEHRSKVFTIVTCNRITQLPPELKRRFDYKFNVDLPHEGSRYEILKVHLKRFCGKIPEWNVYDWKKIISEYNECTPDEISKAVHKAAVDAFDRGEARQITVEDLLHQRTLFEPANVANPEQIASIRLHSKHEMKAASDDNSEFKVNRVPAFEKMLGRNNNAR
jgi:ATPase family associated with various cellular activities (AAA)